jgi:hypothetical protein
MYNEVERMWQIKAEMIFLSNEGKTKNKEK